MTDPQQSAAPEVLDVFLAGLSFFDIIFTGLSQPPRPGAETSASGMGSGPGGIANYAVALSRLGLRTSLAAAFGEDVYGDYCWNVLSEQEGVDLSRSRRFAGWHSPVTASFAFSRDRAMVTHGHKPPLTADELIGDPPVSRAAVAHLSPDRQSWLELAHARGTLVFADAGWDEAAHSADAIAEQLSLCHAFMPNADEAMAYTRARTPDEALAKLARLVPVAVITQGADGVLAADAVTGESASVAGLNVDVLDATGAGDVFGAGFVAATLAGWPLADRLRFANLGAALSVQQFSGALGAPGWAGIARWWRAIRSDPAASGLRRDYAFLDDVIPQHAGTDRRVRYAAATIGFTAP
ncbi:MAG TPA: PfkB family carbohydrate kinase [Trebonia sp.]|nr:PfkB family carbohydrate kinase [Trebonia sp.]